MRGDDQRALPRLCADLEPVGGRIKERAADFVVEEVPLYPPSGEGEHLYVTLRREDRTTPDLRRALGRVFGLSDVDVGCAGMKDRRAVATQTFSLRDGALAPEEAMGRIRDELGVEVLEVRRHVNKLRTGHLLGNRFDILVREPREGAGDRARTAAERLKRVGLPAFYGPQRFGADRRNVERGLEALGGRRMPRRKLDLMISALQAERFNAWLAERIEDGLHETMIAGDVARTEGRGGLFDVEEPEIDTARMLAGEISPTGPIFGFKMRRASGGAGEREERLLAEIGLELADFRRVRSPGARRPSRFLVPELEVVEDPEGLRLRFFLRKGGFATALLAELGVPVTPGEIEEHEDP